MTSIVQRAPVRPIPRLRPRRGLVATLRAAARRMLRPAAGRVLDLNALSDGMRRDLGLDRLGR